MRPLPFVYLCLLCLLSIQTTSYSQTFTLLKDINPDPSGIDDFFPLNVNGTIYFTANDGVHGVELWKSDGTTAGTVMVKDVNPGIGKGVTGALINVNGTIFFSGNDGSHGAELWKSDGTESGTVMVKDIWPGSIGRCNILPTKSVNANGTLFFQADNGSTGFELWKSDGTETGTVLVKDINPGVYPSGINAGKPRLSDPTYLTYTNGVVFFSAQEETNGQELWKTDGTTVGTVLVKDVYPGASPSIIRNCIAVNNVFYFTAHVGTDFQLWKSDGTTAGTISLRTMSAIGITDTWPTAFNNFLYYLDEDGLYRSDGTAPGTFKIADATQTPYNLISANNSLYFIGSNVSSGTELWKSDGTSTGTSMVKDINPGPDGSVYSGLAKVGNKLIFSASDGFHGYELWKSDGSEAGTAVLQTTDPDNAQEYQIVEAGGNAYAVINTTTYGKELWIANVNSPILLPLTFLEFKGTIINDDGQLLWKTDHETQTSSFIVERSTDGNNYKQVGYVNAANAAGINSYGFKDEAITTLGVQRIYYRLKQIDINGKFNYSRIVVLSIDNKASFVMIYPNPVQRDINLTLTLAQKSKLQWQLVDNGGRVIKTGMYDLHAGSTSVSIEAGTLRAGTYYLQLKGEGLQQVLKVMKQ